MFGGAERFPLLLRWALLGPFALLVLSWLIAMMTRGNNDTAGFWLVTTGVAALIEMIAVPTAIFLLLRHAGRYGSVGNVLMTLLAALPIVPAVFVIILFTGRAGTFHI